MDRLWVPEAFLGRYNVFDSAGAFIKNEPRALRVVARRQHPLENEGGGRFIDEGARSDAVLLLRVDTSGQVLDSLAPLPFPEIPHSIRGMILRPSQTALKLVSNHFLPRLVWCLAPDGTIWSSETGALRLVQRTLRGDTIRIVETVHRETPLSWNDRRIISQGLSEMDFGRSDLPVVRPVVQAVHVLDDGHVLVQVVEEVGEDSNLLDVFDREGRFLGSIRTTFTLASKAVPAILGDTIVAVTLGEFDVPYVVRATIHRPPG